MAYKADKKIDNGLVALHNAPTETTNQAKKEGNKMTLSQFKQQASQSLIYAIAKAEGCNINRATIQLWILQTTKGAN